MFVNSDSPRTEFSLNNFTQPKDLALAIKELNYLGGDTNTGNTHTHTHTHTHTLVLLTKYVRAFIQVLHRPYSKVAN